MEEEDEFIDSVYSSLGGVVSRSVECRYNFDDESLDFYDVNDELQGSFVDDSLGVEDRRDLCCFLAAKFYGVLEEDLPEFFDNFLFRV